MAVPNTLLVTNAGYTPVNGTYNRVADVDGYPAWENGSGTYTIQITTGGPTVRWAINGLPYVGGGPSCNSVYSTNFAIPGPTWPGEYPGDPAADPIAWTNECLGTGNAPVVSVPTDCSIPANRCAFAAGGESGRSRFRRLVALGYV
ncbi:MAG: hypothetical protein EBU08_09750 [Micrococcales bacterium]|nr:hypothetical protein [Micrococcales bacterium]